MSSADGGGGIGAARLEPLPAERRPGQVALRPTERSAADVRLRWAGLRGHKGQPQPQAPASPEGHAAVPRCRQAEGRSWPWAWAVTGTEKALTSLLTVVKIDRDLSGQTCEETGIVGLRQGQWARRANHSNHSSRRVSRAPGGKGVGGGAGRAPGAPHRAAWASAPKHGQGCERSHCCRPKPGLLADGKSGGAGAPQEHDSTRHRASMCPGMPTCGLTVWSVQGG